MAYDLFRHGPEVKLPRVGEVTLTPLRTIIESYHEKLYPESEARMISEMLIEGIRSEMRRRIVAGRFRAGLTREQENIMKALMGL